MNWLGIPIILFGLMFFTLAVVKPEVNDKSPLVLRAIVGRMKPCWGDNWPAGCLLYAFLLVCFGLLNLFDVFESLKKGEDRRFLRG